VETDLVQIRRLGEKKTAENAKFRTWLKRHNFVERRLKRIAEEVEEAIDCRACANCCRVATARVNERDIERLAKATGTTVDRFLREYTADTEEEGRILRRTNQGCVFLEGNECTVYDHRPDSCRDFPHLVRGPGSFLSRLWDMPDRATYCPIAYNALEEFKKETGFR
jgi:Fe-S-cluster containining protein